MILVVSRGRLQKTFFNVGFILSEMKSGRPAYLANEELDVKKAGRYHTAAREVEVDFADPIRRQSRETCERFAVHPVDGEDVARGEEPARPGMQDAIVERRCATQGEQLV